MGFDLEGLEPIFGEPKVTCAVEGEAPPSTRFLLHVHGADPSHLRILVTDFHSNTFESVHSISQLDDMRDNTGIAGSWSDFIDYIMASLKSQDAKLIMERGAAIAKLVAQKSKGMPVVSFIITELVDSAARAAIADLSFALYKAFNNIHDSYRQEKERSSQLTKALAAEKEKNENIQSQLEQFSKMQKLQKTSSPGKLNNGFEHSPEKEAPRDNTSTKVTNRVVPAYRRARVRGVLLQDTEDVEDK